MGLAPLALLGGISAAELSFWILWLSHVGVGPAHFESLLFLLVSMWLLFYILNFRSSVQLVFRWFSELNVR